jgi:hypothetical protein
MGHTESKNGYSMEQAPEAAIKWAGFHLLKISNLGRKTSNGCIQKGFA